MKQKTCEQHIPKCVGSFSALECLAQTSLIDQSTVHIYSVNNNKKIPLTGQFIMNTFGEHMKLKKKNSEQQFYRWKYLTGERGHTGQNGQTGSS